MWSRGPSSRERGSSSSSSGGVRRAGATRARRGGWLRDPRGRDRDGDPRGRADGAGLRLHRERALASPLVRARDGGLARGEPDGDLPDGQLLRDPARQHADPDLGDLRDRPQPSSTIPSSTGQALGGQYGNDACPSTALAAACYPVQNITGPDGQSYTVDTYVDYADPSTLAIVTPAAGLTLKLVTVVVRDGKTGAVLANDSSAFHSS